jgi:small subunit ribosomal protein S17
LERIQLVNNVGIPGVKAPEKECSDVDCPFHGHLKVRGRVLTGKVISIKMNHTIVIQRDYAFYIKKYQRYERRNSKTAAHLPSCLDVKVGDVVRIGETHKLSKIVSFVVMDKIEENK